MERLYTPVSEAPGSLDSGRSRRRGRFLAPSPPIVLQRVRTGCWVGSCGAPTARARCARPRLSSEKFRVRVAAAMRLLSRTMTRPACRGGRADCQRPAPWPIEEGSPRGACPQQCQRQTVVPEATTAAAARLEASERWPTRRLNEVATLLPSHSVATAGDASVAVVTTACLTEPGFGPTRVKAARMWAEDVAGATLSLGEVLIARSNTAELVGRAAMYRGEPPGVVASDLTTRIRTGQELDAAFLARYLSALFLGGYWRHRAGGASGSMTAPTCCAPTARISATRRFGASTCSSRGWRRRSGR